MQTRLYSVTATILALLCLSAASLTVQAQHEHHDGQAASQGEKKELATQHQRQGASTDTSRMAQDPHHALALAYYDVMAVFAKALRHNAGHTNVVDAEFARDAVSEIRRAFDQMRRHHQEGMKTVGGDAHAQHQAMMKQSGEHTAQVPELLDALERETSVDQPDARRVSDLAGELLKHLDAMSGMHGGGLGDHKHE